MQIIRFDIVIIEVSNIIYLEQIREGQAAERKRRQQSKNLRSRKTAEAIEIVFGIGDMDNTGYDQSVLSIIYWFARIMAYL